METIIKTINLTKRFKSLVSVDNLNLTVFRGDVFGFLGPNGAGKSTTIRMLLSLIYPTKGEIFLFDKSLKKNYNEIIKKVGAIVEKPDFYLYLTAYKNLEILTKLYGINPTKNQIMEILELVGLKDRAFSKVKTYSHGMKQRLGIAQALLHNPDLIILDEPTVGLDPQGMKEIRELIVMLSKEKGKTIFLSSHILSEVEAVANRMIILNKGKVVIEGNVQELLNQKQSDFIFKLADIFAAKTFLINNGFIEGEDFILEKDDIILKTNKITGPELNKLFILNNIEVLSFGPERQLEKYFLEIIKEN